ncbi:zinc finger protein 654-like [Dunckerocampus dactyliophorus]|uniref:zinc finger protein 654-like n=1 Tax=Dunckerocampus dactyliophorus TaxID=161453 RepID=UPI0024055EF8|nr:zinc finger protein 654-like [Dunckerocampus dactyliophorus]
MVSVRPGNLDDEPDAVGSMADGESDIETDGLELALESLCSRYCSDVSDPKSKDYCSEFCTLVEEYTGQWQVPLPQLKVLRTALCSFTKATAKFPDGCQHIHNLLSRLALSFFELMLFFSKEEFGEEPLRHILDSYQACHLPLLRHRNIYLQHLKQIINAGGPWENQVLQGILQERNLPPKEVEDYLSSELPVFLELRVRYLQACERIQEAMALAKVCLENHKTGKHLYLHQAYLTCLYKTSLHEHLHKEMADIDGHDAVEIICNTERVEKDELLLSLCKAFLAQQLHNGDMYYIWDLVFIWSRLHLRAHPSTPDFLAECLQLASSATNVRAIFPFIKLVTSEVGVDGVQACMELCARALQLCDTQADAVAQSLVYKTIAFLLPRDLEICRACALLVFCLERSLETYRTVRLLYMHPDQEPHPHDSPVRTNVRFKILQMLKERLCFDPEFWNILALRTRCLELINDNVMKDALLSEIEEEEEEEYCEELSTSTCINDSYVQDLSSSKCTETAFEDQTPPQECTSDSNKAIIPSSHASLRKRKWGKRLHRRIQLDDDGDDEADQGDDPEFTYNLKPASLSSKAVYALRRNHTKRENCSSVKLPLNREYLSRCVKSQIMKRKGRRKRWLQGLPTLEAAQTVQEKVVLVKGKKRGRKPSQKWEVSYPDNEISLPEEEFVLRENSETGNTVENELELERAQKQGRGSDCSETQEDGSDICSPASEPQTVAPAVEADRELDRPRLDFISYPVELLHNYHLSSTNNDTGQPAESSAHGVGESQLPEESSPKGKRSLTWKEKFQRGQKYCHIKYYCSLCQKSYKGLNVWRHAVAHLKRSRRCILCGKRFPNHQGAKKHIWDHIEELRKNNNKEVQEIPATNGMTKDQTEKVPKVSSAHTQRLSSVKHSKLSREERIIRNFRFLLKKLKKDDTNVAMQFGFEDEQVVIKDSLVIVRSPHASKKENELEGEDKPAGENGYGVDLKCLLCPSVSCDRVFLKISSTMIKHATSCHLHEDVVLDKTFVWSKHKCTFCSRKMQILQHYKEHIRRHDPSMPHFCYHSHCDRRFLTPQELKEHVNTHNPFQPQCVFTNCDRQFSTLLSLFDHEWRHYVPAPHVDSSANRIQRESIKAPWKQRVKVEELWLQKPGPRESFNSSRVCENAYLGDLRETSKVREDNDCLKATENNRQPVNGCEDVRQVSSITPPQRTDAAPPKKKKSPTKKPISDPLNVKEPERGTGLPEVVQHKVHEPLITEHKNFNPQDQSYPPSRKAPFIRPPPSSYMDESLLAMRKRRDINQDSKTDDCPSGSKSQKDHEQKIRHRCKKCLSSFNSVQDLEKHTALNTCSALFGFDSDDES